MLETDLEKMEKPQPAKVLKDHTAYHRGETGGGIENEVDERDALASFVHKVHVSNRRDDKRLKGRG